MLCDGSRCEVLSVCPCCPHPSPSPLDRPINRGPWVRAQSTQTRLCLARETAPIAGLYVPTSDIDLVVEHSSHGNIVRALHALANGISRKGIAKSVQVRAVLAQALPCRMATHPAMMDQSTACSTGAQQEQLMGSRCCCRCCGTSHSHTLSQALSCIREGYGDTLSCIGKAYGHTKALPCWCWLEWGSAAPAPIQQFLL